MERIAALLHEARVAVTVVRAVGKFKRLTKVHHDPGTEDGNQAGDVLPRDGNAPLSASTGDEAEDKGAHSSPASPSHRHRPARRKSSIVVVPGIVSPGILTSPTPESKRRRLPARLRQPFKRGMGKVAPTGAKKNAGHFSFVRSMPGLSAFGVRIAGPRAQGSSK